MLFRSELRLGVDSNCGRGEPESLFRLHLFTGTLPISLVQPDNRSSHLFPTVRTALRVLIVMATLLCAQLASFIQALSESYLLSKPLHYTANNVRLCRVPKAFSRSCADPQIFHASGSTQTEWICKRQKAIGLSALGERPGKVHTSVYMPEC